METENVRVRFAPSPTGFLHVGGLRTALYNVLFARKHGGTAVLRIEDTDRSRYVEGAVENLLRTLEWAGLRFEEGPMQGGAYGPYVQSERTALYRAHADRLLAEGKAYRCFCTPEELAASRERQIAEKKDPTYDRRCRALGEGEIRVKRDTGMPFTVRMKVPLVGQLQFHDLIRGEVTVHTEAIDDQVLLKSDGFPTYHLANVVDDHHMRISHVIRGEEWLPSTAKHVLLYEFLGWEAPLFAHLPLLLNPDRSKLSKRQGDVAVEDYRRKGFLPEALVNFVAMLGWNPGDDRELFTMSELEKEFSLERVGKTGAVFDGEKLRWFNAQYLRALPPDRLVEACLPWMRETGFDMSDPQRTRRVVSAHCNYLTLPSDITEYLSVFTQNAVVIPDAESRSMVEAAESQLVFRRFIELAQSQDPWTGEEIKALIKTIQKDTGIKGKLLFMPLRLAITGEQHGPDLGMIAELLGRETVINRVEAQIR
ncbi:MAG: glutamate--tRNA ligase [Bacteroidetes bacterium]|nr:glutamate--tRNA ligase [Bacteroidota bacterium]